MADSRAYGMPRRARLSRWVRGARVVRIRSARDALVGERTADATAVVTGTLVIAGSAWRLPGSFRAACTFDFFLAPSSANCSAGALRPQRTVALDAAALALSGRGEEAALELGAPPNSSPPPAIPGPASRSSCSGMSSPSSPPRYRRRRAAAAGALAAISSASLISDDVRLACDLLARLLGFDEALSD